MAAIFWIQCKTIDQSCIKYIIYMDKCFDNVTEIFVSHKVGVWSGFSSTRTNTLTNYKQEAMKILFRFWTMVSLYFRFVAINFQFHTKKTLETAKKYDRKLYFTSSV